MKTRSERTASIIVGRKHTGKSTRLAKIAQAYVKTGQKCLIIDVNGSPAYNAIKECSIEQVKRLKSGVAKLVGTPGPDELKTIAGDFRGGLVIFEDCTKYITGNVRPEVRTFLVDHRMMDCDLIFTFHSLVSIPPFFWQMISFVELLKTQENFENPRNRQLVPNYNKVLDAFKKVNSQADDYFAITVETLV